MAEERWYGKRRKARALGALAAVAAGGLAAIAVPAGAASAATASAPTQTLSCTTAGEHAFTVPYGTTSIHVVAIGGRGGGGYTLGGPGARVEADVRVSGGSTLYAEVGGNGAPAVPTMGVRAAGGANGGNPGGAVTSAAIAQAWGVSPASGAGGGGASDLQTCPVASCQPINTGTSAMLLLVAGGGGGAGSDNEGGSGGTPVGGDALLPAGAWWAVENGGGATDSADGSNWQYTTLLIHPGPQPANAQCAGDSGDSFGGGGGGGGFYCGGGGGSPSGVAAGGGGGSSYGPAGSAYSVSTQDPSVTITYQTAFRLAPASRSSLTLDGASGYVVQQVPTGARSQLWQLVPQGAQFEIVNLANGGCLTTFGSAGTQLFLYDCTPSQYNLWQLPANFGLSASGSLIWNPACNLFVDVSSGSTTAGAAIDAQPYNGGNANQYFLTFPG